MYFYQLCEYHKFTKVDCQLCCTSCYSTCVHVWQMICQYWPLINRIRSFYKTHTVCSRIPCIIVVVIIIRNIKINKIVLFIYFYFRVYDVFIYRYRLLFMICTLMLQWLTFYHIYVSLYKKWQVLLLYRDTPVCSTCIFFVLLFFQLMRWTDYSSLQIIRFLRMVIALFGNNTLYVDPYVIIVNFNY